MAPNKNLQFWLKKRARRKTGFPLATIAYYGPDDSFATKLVVGIMLSEKDQDDAILKKWFGTNRDVRFDPIILAEMMNFLEQYDIHRAAMLERIIGCPHEEGIDYPLGEKCPQCPFWADKDRWTGKKIS